MFLLAAVQFVRLVASSTGDFTKVVGVMREDSIAFSDDLIAGMIELANQYFIARAPRKLDVTTGSGVRAFDSIDNVLSSIKGYRTTGDSDDDCNTPDIYFALDDIAAGEVALFNADKACMKYVILDQSIFMTAYRCKQATDSELLLKIEDNLRTMRTYNTINIRCESNTSARPLYIRARGYN